MSKSNGPDADTPIGCYQVDDELIEVYGAKIGVYGIAVYSALAMLAGQSGPFLYHASPTHAEIAAMLGCSRRKVMNTIAALADAGLIAVDGRTRTDGGRMSNVYRLAHDAR